MAVQLNDSQLKSGSAFLKNDGTVALSSNLPAGGQKVTGLGAPAEAGDAARYDEVVNKLPLAGGTMSGAIAMGGQKVTGLGAPSEAGDAARYEDVQAALVGLDFKDSVIAATTTMLPSYTHDAGVLTASGNGELSNTYFDGVTLAQGKRVLVKDESGWQQYNGIYVITQLGDGSNPWVLTRASDANADADVTIGLWVYVEGGSTNGGTAWVLSSASADPIVLGTTSLTFARHSGPLAASSVATSHIQDEAVTAAKESRYGRHTELGLGFTEDDGFPTGGLVAGIGNEWKIEQSETPDNWGRIQSANCTQNMAAYGGGDGSYGGKRLVGSGGGMSAGGFSNPSGADKWKLAVIYLNPMMGATSLYTSESLEGDDTTPPTEPTLDASYIKLATVKVKYQAGGTPVISNADISDMRRRMGHTPGIDVEAADGTAQNYGLSKRVWDSRFADVRVYRNGLRCKKVTSLANPNDNADCYVVENRVGETGDGDEEDTFAGAVTNGSTVRFGAAPTNLDDLFFDYRY